MSRDRAKKILKQIKYKPGFKLSMDESGDVEILLTAPNAYGRGTSEARAYVVREAYHQLRTNAQFVDRVADAIWRLENHEYMEWFKYKGRRLYDPKH